MKTRIKVLRIYYKEKVDLEETFRKMVESYGKKSHFIPVDNSVIYRKENSSGEGLSCALIAVVFKKYAVSNSDDILLAIKEITYKSAADYEHLLQLKIDALEKEETKNIEVVGVSIIKDFECKEDPSTRKSYVILGYLETGGFSLRKEK